MRPDPFSAIFVELFIFNTSNNVYVREAGQSIQGVYNNISYINTKFSALLVLHFAFSSFSVATFCSFLSFFKRCLAGDYHGKIARLL